MRIRVRSNTLLAILFLIMSTPTFPQTHIPEGTVNGKWLKQNSPYFIDGEIKIPRGNKLIIEAGAKVIFTGHYKLIVNGILEAKGTEQDSIYFFPSDTAVGWHGIRFMKAENFSTLEYCVLRNGKTDIRPMEEGYYEKCESDPDCDENDFDGGVILMNQSNPIILRCLITDNKSDMHGGAIAIKNHSNPRISNCQIKYNIARDNGGGIFCVFASNPIITNCLIFSNTAFGDLGGGITSQNYCSPIIDRCVIKNNETKYKGGGICFYTNSKPVIKNSIIIDNKAVLGGGIYIDEFYNVFREQPGKIDIQITNTRIENNSAEYGGGIWLRDAMGELKGATICNNRASIAGGGVHIEYNPFLFKFSSENPCNIFMNFARMMGNDLFRLGGGGAMKVSLDTFTVKYYSALNAEPVKKFPLTIKNFKLAQVNTDLYVSPDGDDSNSGLSSSEPLKSLKIALLRILADSTNPRTIFMDKGEYIFTETNDILLLDKHKYVSVKGAGFTEVIFGTDRITVFTPWWINTWALIIYSSVVIGIIIMIVNVRTRRFRIKSELEKKEFEAQKLHEVDEIKTRFFTNISHEFRTPLTLILGPAKQLLERFKDDKAKEQLDLIHRSAKKLNRLVDELLDISKIEAGEMKLKACQVNIVSVVKEMALSFHSLAERKRITFKLNSDADKITVYIDKDKFDKILSNVLSNAFKFTPEGGKVEVELKASPKSSPKERTLKSAFSPLERGTACPALAGEGVCQKGGTAEIKISDTGVGIQKDQLEKIFDRFYQVDDSHTREHEGTGIGLALTKELVDLHKGKIEVESDEGKGSTFRLIFPLGKDHLRPEEICEEDKLIDKDNKKTCPPLADKDEGKARPNAVLEDFVEIENENRIDIESVVKPELPSLLIVDDNSDVRKYVSMILEHHYKIIEAVDGEDGLNKAFESASGGPDLIISDIMMPKVDGFQLCKQLKTDLRTSHIPVIMLTAKATTKDKISGLEIGADDYIMKPFEADELKARIKNLLEQRKRLHEHFRKYGLVESAKGGEEKNITPCDQKFVQKAVEVINEHISDTSFGVEMLADDMAVSRSLLLKKLEVLVGESPNELIRRIRLDKAANLLKHNSGNISEIALEVGFTNPSYFAEAFKKQFGVPPSQYHSKS